MTGHKLKILFSILVFFMATTRAFAGVPDPNFKSGAPATVQCTKAVSEGNQKCFVLEAAVDKKSSAIGSEATVNSQGADVVKSAQTGVGVADVGMIGAQIIIEACTSAIKECVTGCKATAEALHTQIASTPAEDPKRQEYVNDLGKASQTAQNCSNIFGAEVTKSTKQTAMSASAKAQYLAALKAAQGDLAMGSDAISGTTGGGKGVGDWIMDHKGTIALGALGAYGVSRMLSKHHDDDGDAPDTTETAQELAAAAAADPTCQSERSYEFSHCQNYLKSLCGKPTEMDNAKCVKFADQYCGFYTSTKAKVEGAPAEGLDTQLCADTMAHSYCSKVDRSGCYSCLRMRDMATATCQSQPAACERTPSDAEMTQYKAACTDDPVFALPKWAHIPAPAAASSAASSVAMGTGALTISSIMGEGSASFASKSVVLPVDVAPERGPTILAQTTQAIQKLCLEGALNNCGVRRGIQ